MVAGTLVSKKQMSANQENGDLLADLGPSSLQFHTIAQQSLLDVSVLSECLKIKNVLKVRSLTAKAPSFVYSATRLTP